MLFLLHHSREQARWALRCAARIECDERTESAELVGNPCIAPRLPGFAAGEDRDPERAVNTQHAGSRTFAAQIPGRRKRGQPSETSSLIVTLDRRSRSESLSPALSSLHHAESARDGHSDGLWPSSVTKEGETRKKTEPLPPSSRNLRSKCPGPSLRNAPSLAPGLRLRRNRDDGGEGARPLTEPCFPYPQTTKAWPPSPQKLSSPRCLPAPPCWRRRTPAP